MATTESGTRTTRRASRNREAIVDAAEQLLMEGGATAVTLAAVAERADVAVQTIYNRVGSRSALLVAVAVRALKESRQYMDAAYADTAGGARGRLKRAGGAWARFAIERPVQFRILLDPPAEPRALDEYAAVIREQNGKLADAIRDGIADGEIRDDVAPWLAANAAWAAMNGLLALMSGPEPVRPTPAEMGAMLALAIQIIWRGIAVDPGDPLGAKGSS